MFNWIELAFDKRIARVVPVVFVACTSVIDPLMRPHTSVDFFVVVS